MNYSLLVQTKRTHTINEPIHLDIIQIVVRRFHACYVRNNLVGIY